MTQEYKDIRLLSEKEIATLFEAVERELYRRPVFIDRDDAHYILAVRQQFEEIHTLRERHFSFEEIRAYLHAKKLLPDDATKTNSLRKAYYREGIRRKKLEEEGIDPAPWRKMYG